MPQAMRTVLYVEDEESDVLLMRMAFTRHGLESALYSVPDGRSALDYLSGRGLYVDRNLYPLPSVVLLDLNLPGISGFDVLKWIRTQAAYELLPVVIFSSSAREEDRVQAALLRADDYLQKPISSRLLSALVADFYEKWLLVPRIPAPATAQTLPPFP